MSKHYLGDGGHRGDDRGQGKEEVLRRIISSYIAAIGAGAVHHASF
jgi:hypothetical protein